MGGSELLVFLGAKLLVLVLGLGICFLAGDNDAASHSAVVLLILLIDNDLLCSLGCININLDSCENALVVNSKELIKSIGVYELLYRTAKADVDVVALVIGDDTLAERLMCNLCILRNHDQFTFPFPQKTERTLTVAFPFVYILFNRAVFATFCSDFSVPIRAERYYNKQMCQKYEQIKFFKIYFLFLANWPFFMSFEQFCVDLAGILW